MVFPHHRTVQVRTSFRPEPLPTVQVDYGLLILQILFDDERRISMGFPRPRADDSTREVEWDRRVASPLPRRLVEEYLGPLPFL